MRRGRAARNMEREAEEVEALKSKPKQNDHILLRELNHDQKGLSVMHLN